MPIGLDRSCHVCLKLVQQRRPAAAIRGVLQRQVVVTEHGAEWREGLHGLKAIWQGNPVACQKVEEQADVVAAWVVMSMQGKERLDQFLGCLLGVIAEGLVIDVWIIQQPVEPDQSES